MKPMTGPEHFQHGANLLAQAEQRMREAGPTVAEPTTRGVILLMRAAALHVEMAKCAAMVDGARMSPAAGRAWEAVLSTPANIAEIVDGEHW